MRDRFGTVYVDGSTLRAVADCDTRGALRHVLGYTVQEEAHQLQVGIAAHEALADHLRGEPVSRCLGHFEELYRGYSAEHGLDFEDHPMFRLSYRNTSTILAEFFETHPLTSFSFEVNPKLVEVGFALPLGDEKLADGRPAFVFWGRMDAIVQGRHDKALYVLDHKTTGRIAPFFTEKFRNDAQMSGYVWAAQQTIGQPVVGVFINAIEFSKLPSDPVRKCRNHGVAYAECSALHAKSELLIYTRSPEQLDNWKATALSLAHSYRDLLDSVPDVLSLARVPMQGTFTGACGFCDFAKFCGAGRPAHYANVMLQHKPWRPFALPDEQANQ